MLSVIIFNNFWNVTINFKLPQIYKKASLKAGLTCQIPILMANIIYIALMSQKCGVTGKETDLKLLLFHSKIPRGGP